MLKLKNLEDLSIQTVELATRSQINFDKSKLPGFRSLQVMTFQDVTQI